MSAVARAVEVALSLSAYAGLPEEPTDRALLARAVPAASLEWSGGLTTRGATSELTVIGSVRAPELSREEALRISNLLTFSTQGLYAAASQGYALVPEEAVTAWMGDSIRDNYPEAGEDFLKFATTYWTFRVVLRALQDERSAALVHPVLQRVDGFIQPLFFPDDGPFHIPVAKRRADQRLFLESFATPPLLLRVEEFLDGNPILLRDAARERRKRFWR